MAAGCHARISKYSSLHKILGSMNKTATYHLETTLLGSENNMETNPKNGFNFGMNMILQTWIWTILGNVTVNLMEWHSFKRCPITWCWTNIQLQWFICHLWLFIFPMFVRLLSAVVGGKKYIYIYTVYIYISDFFGLLSPPQKGSTGELLGMVYGMLVE